MAKFFLGDNGSYFLGIVIGFLTIQVYGKYQSLPTWSAILIVCYPTLEVTFSYIRKILSKYSPFKADDKHLHLKLFKFIKSGYSSNRLSNALVAPFMSPIWLMPMAIFPYALKLSSLSILAVLIMIAFYLFYYKAIPDIPKKIIS